MTDYDGVRTESATDMLRRLLDERGVEYETDDTQVSDTEWYYVTKLRDGCHDRWIYEEPPDCDLLVSYQYDLGAEDAIAATLGSCNCSNNCTNGERTETCHDKNGFDPELGFECTVCGAMTDGYMLSPADMGHYTQFNFCPMCGRRIEQ